MTRVKQPDQDDWNKLLRCVRYWYSTPHIVLTLSASTLPMCKWWIDAEYATNLDCRSQTGGTFSLGKGSIINSSLKQKINTRSSTEAELVAMDDMASHVMWTNYFLQSQGYITNGTIIYQDNKSSLLLEANGHFSRSKRSKHISVRYFLLRIVWTMEKCNYSGVHPMTWSVIISLNHFKVICLSNSEI